MKVGQHITRLMKRLRFMENHKKIKPLFSTACDRLFNRCTELLGSDNDKGGVIERETEQ